ncbi:MAG: hypothetical protein AB7R55_19605 [Gemmatimonadales bacterium]
MEGIWPESGLLAISADRGPGSIDEYRTIRETFNLEALKAIGDWIVAHTTPIH